MSCADADCYFVHLKLKYDSLFRHFHELYTESKHFGARGWQLQNMTAGENTFRLFSNFIIKNVFFEICTLLFC